VSVGVADAAVKWVLELLVLGAWVAGVAGVAVVAGVVGVSAGVGLGEAGGCGSRDFLRISRRSSCRFIFSTRALRAWFIFLGMGGGGGECQAYTLKRQW